MTAKSTPDKQNGDPASLYLFFGDEFLVAERLRALEERILTPELATTNKIVFDGSRLDIDELSSYVFTPSLFGDARLIIVEECTAFMGRADQRTLVNKTLRAWKSGDRSGALKGFGQLLSLNGLDRSAVGSGSAWIAEILGDRPDTDAAETLSELGAHFLEQDREVKGVADESEIEKLIESRFPTGTVLAFTASAVNKRKRLFKAVSEKGRVVECAVRQDRYGVGLDRDFFNQRVTDMAKSLGKTVTRDALDEMYARSGTEMRRLDSELQKAFAFVGDRKKVTREDIVAVVGDFHLAAFYELNNSLREGNSVAALRALHENLKIVDHPLQIVASTANEFRKLTVARELLVTLFRNHWKPGLRFDEFKRIARDVREASPEPRGKLQTNLLKMKDYPLYLLLKDAGRFPMQRLLSSLEAALEADILMKSTGSARRSPHIILENMVLKICSGGT